MIKMYRLMGDHIRDWTKFTTDTISTYVPNAVSGDYDYNETTGVFELNPGAGAWDLDTPETLMVHDRTSGVIDVSAFIKTKFFITDTDRYSSTQMQFKRDITKMMNADDGDETDNLVEDQTDVFVFNDGANIGNLTESILHYKDPYEINNLTSGEVARVNGTRNYQQDHLSTPSTQSQGIAYKLTASNDCRIHDFYLLTTGRKDSGA